MNNNDAGHGNNELSPFISQLQVEDENNNIINNRLPCHNHYQTNIPFTLNSPPIFHNLASDLQINTGATQRMKLSETSSGSGGNLTILDYDSDLCCVDLEDFRESQFQNIDFNVDVGDTSQVSNMVANSDGGWIGKRPEPSKRLIAERRRRDKLKENLNLLRSVVPNISKLNQTSVVVDAISYIKELLQKIKELNYELKSNSSNLSLVPSADLAATTRFYPLMTPTAAKVPSPLEEDDVPGAMNNTTRPPIRIEVTHQEGGMTNIHMFCGRRSGLLLSIMQTLDDLGFEIHHAVISCFSGFSLDIYRAKRSNVAENLHPDQIKEMLMKVARYHGVA